MAPRKSPVKRINRTMGGLAKSKIAFHLVADREIYTGREWPHWSMVLMRIGEKTGLDPTSIALSTVKGILKWPDVNFDIQVQRHSSPRISRDQEGGSRYSTGRNLKLIKRLALECGMTAAEIKRVCELEHHPADDILVLNESALRAAKEAVVASSDSNVAAQTNGAASNGSAHAPS